jgi:hypothetical protein
MMMHPSSSTSVTDDDDDDNDEFIPEWIENREEDDDDDDDVDNDSTFRKSDDHPDAAEAEETACLPGGVVGVQKTDGSRNDDDDDGSALLSPSSSSSSAAAAAILLLESAFSEDHVAALVLRHLSIQDIAVASLVSKTLYRAASRSNDALWKSLFHDRWNISPSRHRVAMVEENDENGHDERMSSNNNIRSSSSSSYFRAYQQAHLHPHDLWITHWNCCFPADGLSPGRCCIRGCGGGRRRREEFSSSSSSSSSKRQPPVGRNGPTFHESDSNATVASAAAHHNHNQQGVEEQEEEDIRESKCPACRDFNLLPCTDDDDDDDVDASSIVSLLNKHGTNVVAAAVATSKIRNNNNNILRRPVRSMAAQTRSLYRQLTRCLDSHHVNDAQQQQQQGCGSARQEHCARSSSRRAFARAATFHRRLDTRQFEQPGHPTHFLTDLLFFNLSDPSSVDGQWEMEQLLQEIKLPQQHDEALLQHEYHLFDHATAAARPNPLPTPSLSQVQQLHETAHHSWHIIELTNPDWNRPILYEFVVQRPDCFTIYPSQGLIEPGQKAFAAVGVRPLGSALAHAFETLNVRRDGLFDDHHHHSVAQSSDGNTNVSNSAQWADLYAEQAHLPLMPFMVRYRFAMAPPESNIYFGSGQDYAQQQHTGREVPSLFVGGNGNDDDYDDGDGDTDHSQRRRHEQAAMLDCHWTQNVPVHQMRSIHLSAHVHSHYSYWDFFDKTCSPWDFARDVISSDTTTSRCLDDGPIFMAPNLRELFPYVYSKAVEMTQKHASKIPKRTTTSICSLTKGYSSPSLVLTTEGPCSECGQLWECREEECMQIFILDKATSCMHLAKRRLLMQNIRTCIQAVGRLPSRNDDSQVARLCTLLCAVFSTLQAVKAAPWVTLRQKRVLVAWEQVVDDYFCQLSRVVAGKADWYPWRLSGTFKYSLCTESVFGGPVLCDSGNDEPIYLDPFRHLIHSPGFFCLGRQEDVNHIEQSNVMLSASSPRYVKKPTGFGTSDMFMDNPISALQAGFCMVQDPRSLLVHGLYDSIEYPGTIVRRPRIPLLESTCSRDEEKNPTTTIDICYNLSTYVHGTPPPGVGRFALSKSVSATNDGPLTIVEMNPHDVIEVHAACDAESSAVHRNRPRHLPHRDPPVENRGLQFVQLLWSLGAQLGLAVRPDGPPVFVDRKILIASQWMAISIMIGPLLVTLLTRCAFRIPSQPVDYNLDGFPFDLSSKMRYLTEMECGCAAALLVVFWLALGRWTERHTDRDFFRVMLEHTLPPSNIEKNCLARIETGARQFVLRQWDAMCPLFLQRQVFSPSWNRRSHEEFFKHVAFWRSHDALEQRSPPVVRAAAGRAWNTMFGDRRDRGIIVGTVSSIRKVMVAIMAVLGSFCSSTPHFWLNLFTVFACSISLGMSVSLLSMEKGRSSPTAIWSTTGSMLVDSNLLTIVITSFLVGQLVGSSGGIMFLAEFVVTSVSLVLGGAGTVVSASAMESWGCMFCLSSTAFWGYLLARVAIVDGVRSKRKGYTSFLLSNCIVLLCLFWISVLVMPFDSHVSLIIQQPGHKEIRNWTRKYAEKKLQ